MKREEFIRYLKCAIENHEENDAHWYLRYKYISICEKMLNYLEQESILDKIRAEIEECNLSIDNAISYDELKIEGMKEAYVYCLKIIDKYKAESEDNK